MDPVQAGLACGSDTAHLSMFGYDPRLYYRGRGAFETMGAGLDMLPGDIAFKVCTRNFPCFLCPNMYSRLLLRGSSPTRREASQIDASAAARPQQEYSGRKHASVYVTRRLSDLCGHIGKLYPLNRYASRAKACARPSQLPWQARQCIRHADECSCFSQGSVIIFEVV